jgi:dTMP kinase
MLAPVFKIVSTLTSYRGNSNGLHPRPETNKYLLHNSVVFRLFAAGILFEQILRVLIKICLPSILNKKVIICDRYLIDTIITDIGLKGDLSRNEIMFLLQRCLPIFPKADLIFLINVPPKIALQRKKDAYSIKTLEYLSNTYLYAGKKIGATIIDGTKDPSELISIILSKLRSIGVEVSY